MATEPILPGGENRQIYEQSSLRENDSHSYSPFQVRGIRFIYIYKNNPSQLRNSVTLLDQPQSFSRSWAVGCSHSAMKSALIQGSSNHLSQDSPTGVIMRVRPTTTISTCVTSSGRATASGRYTPWPRPHLKTVDSITRPMNTVPCEPNIANGPGMSTDTGCTRYAIRLYCI